MTIAYRASDTPTEAHDKGRLAARGGIPRKAPATYGRGPLRVAWLWGWDHERALG
ncbi:MAG: hypothetical protein KDJ16_03910 [Hyphomicrobiales bacterium]|nr:hypothetical protein [Hyphomicrobiales bacterium]